MPALVVNDFAPSSRHRSPGSGVPVVPSLFLAAPAPVSLHADAASHRPDASFGSSSAFCARVPHSSIRALTA
jgi:hypothetical protein